MAFVISRMVLRYSLWYVDFIALRSSSRNSPFATWYELLEAHLVVRASQNISITASEEWSVIGRPNDPDVWLISKALAVQRVPDAVSRKRPISIILISHSRSRQDGHFAASAGSAMVKICAGTGRRHVPQKAV